MTLKPRTYRKEARAAYLKIARVKSKSKKQIRKGLKEQLAYIRRNIKTINTLWDLLEIKLTTERKKELKDKEIT